MSCPKNSKMVSFFPRGALSLAHCAVDGRPCGGDKKVLSDGPPWFFFLLTVGFVFLSLSFSLSLSLSLSLSGVRSSPRSPSSLPPQTTTAETQS